MAVRSSLFAIAVTYCAVSLAKCYTIRCFCNSLPIITEVRGTLFSGERHSPLNTGVPTPFSSLVVEPFHGRLVGMIAQSYTPDSFRVGDSRVKNVQEIGEISTAQGANQVFSHYTIFLHIKQMRQNTCQPGWAHMPDHIVPYLKVGASDMPIAIELP